jgi:NAD+ synthase
MYDKGVQMVFDVEIETENAVQWIKQYFAKQPHAKGAVIGISGGKDSAVCAALLVDALGKDRVLGVSLPNGKQKDIDDACAVAEQLGIEYKVVNINLTYRALLFEIENVEKEVSELAEINMLPRLRMTALYALSANRHYRVCGTGNMSEDYVGYCTKWGDAAWDFNPIQYFTTEEVVEIGDFMGLPEQVMHKTPSDGICGKSDEDNLGISYADINKVIRGRASEVDPEVFKKIMEKHRYNLHKVQTPPCYKPEWSISLG